MFQAVAYSQIQTAFGANAELNRSSVFARHEYMDNKGLPLSIGTHQFRHFLNTLAQTGGLSQIDIAKWSGRANIHQNAAYDHESGPELLDRMREALGDGEGIIGPRKPSQKRCQSHELSSQGSKFPQLRPRSSASAFMTSR